MVLFDALFHSVSFWSARVFLAMMSEYRDILSRFGRPLHGSSAAHSIPVASLFGLLSFFFFFSSFTLFLLQPKGLSVRVCQALRRILLMERPSFVSGQDALETWKDPRLRHLGTDSLAVP